ncbi:hypothetical protein JCM18237_01440 [Halorubrum luteum]
MRDTVRPVVAAVLAVVLPGLGHLLLRRWGRAILWHATIVGGTVLLYVLYDVEPVDPLADPNAFAAAVPPEVSIPVAFLVGLSAVDAYLVGREEVTAERTRPDDGSFARGRDGPAAARDPDSIPTDAASAATDAESAATDAESAARAAVDVEDRDGRPPEVQCPSCGRKTDAEIDFCHWCTEPLPWADEE